MPFFDGPIQAHDSPGVARTWPRQPGLAGTGWPATGVCAQKKRRRETRRRDGIADTQAAWETLILTGLLRACGVFGNVMVNTPWRNSARALSGSISTASGTLRSNEP